MYYLSVGMFAFGLGPNLKVEVMKISFCKYFVNFDKPRKHYYCHHIEVMYWLSIVLFSFDLVHLKGQYLVNGDSQRKIYNFREFKHLRSNGSVCSRSPYFRCFRIENDI